MAYIPPPLTFDFGLDNLGDLPLEGCAATSCARATPAARRPRLLASIGIRSQY